MKPFDAGDPALQGLGVRRALAEERADRRQQARLLRQREREELRAVAASSAIRGLLDSMPQCVWAARRGRRRSTTATGSGASTPVRARTGRLRSVDAATPRTSGSGCATPGATAHPRRRAVRARAAGCAAPATATYRWHLCRMVPERDERGRIVGWIVHRDRHRRPEAHRGGDKRCSAARRRRAQQAEAANRTKDEFLATRLARAAHAAQRDPRLDADAALGRG